MRAAPADSRSQEQRVDEAIADFLEAEDQGRAPDRREFLARHPDLAAELEAFFGDHDRMVRLSGAPRRGATRCDGSGPREARGEAAAIDVLSTVSHEGKWEGTSFRGIRV